MTNISHFLEYLPHVLNAKYYSVKLYRQTKSINHVCSRYHISKVSFMRCNKKFDGTKKSLIDKSHKPRTPRHKGKVGRIHRNDQNRFYNYLYSYSYDDLIQQIKSYLKRSNNIPMQILGLISLIQRRNQLKSNIK